MKTYAKTCGKQILRMQTIWTFIPIVLTCLFIVFVDLYPSCYIIYTNPQ